MLLCIARDPGERLRDVAAEVGITERAAQRIVHDLEMGGYLTRTRVGRRNTYVVRTDASLRRPTLRHHVVGDLLTALSGLPSGAATHVAGNGSVARLSTPG